MNKPRLIMVGIAVAAILLAVALLGRTRGLPSLEKKYERIQEGMTSEEACAILGPTEIYMLCDWSGAMYWNDDWHDVIIYVSVDGQRGEVKSKEIRPRAGPGWYQWVRGLLHL
jgi:hypothetical protein